MSTGWEIQEIKKNIRVKLKLEAWKSHLFQTQDKHEYLSNNFGPASSWGIHRQSKFKVNSRYRTTWD